MAKCRVYERADGTVRIVHPHAGTFKAAIAHAEKADPSLKGLKHHDVDVKDLPDRASRSTWRLKKGRVVADGD